MSLLVLVFIISPLIATGASGVVLIVLGLKGKLRNSHLAKLPVVSPLRFDEDGQPTDWFTKRVARIMPDINSDASSSWILLLGTGLVLASVVMLILLIFVALAG